MDGDLASVNGTVQLQQSESLFLTVSSNQLGNHSGISAEDNPSINSALMDLEAGRGTQVDVDGHVGCLQKFQYGSNQSYGIEVDWFVGDTSYSVTVSYPQSEYERYSEFIDGFYSTIKID